MRPAVLFTLAVACSAGTPASPPPHVPVAPAPVEPDAAPMPPTSARGGACDPACAAGLLCLPLPGGYCGSFCGVTGTACDASCVETARAGEVCLASCTRDEDCRADEGYVCDPQWRACIVPNFAAIVPKQCPAAAGPVRDLAFGASEAWSSAVTPGLYQLEPTVALTNDGGLAAIYMSRGPITEGNALIVSRSDAKGARLPDGVLRSDRQTQFDPSLARDRTGALYAVWYAFDGLDEHGEIVMATSTDRGATWSTPVPVQDPTDCSGPGECFDKPMIAIGPDPKRKADIIYVMYSAHAAGLRVRASRDGGKTFGTPVTALAGIYGTSTVGADGRLHIVTINGGPLGAFGSAQQKIEYTVSADGGATFGKAITASGRDEVIPFYFSNPSVAVDDRRHWIYVAYARGGRDAKWNIVIAATKDAGKTWSRTKIGDDCAIHMVPNLALDPTTGTLHVAWYDTQGMPGRFAHATCAAGAAKCVQQGAINSAPFAALSTVRHAAKWTGEYESLVIDDKRRMLHATWSQPVEEGGKIIARIFHAAARLR